MTRRLTSAPHPRRLPLAALVTSLVLVTPGAASAAAAICPQPAPGTASALAAQLAARTATAWLGLEHDDGTFTDYLSRGGSGRDHYGPAMLGAGLVLDGLRRCDPQVTHAGLRAIAWAAEHPWPARDGSEHRGVVFENLALAVAYAQARRDLADDATYAAMRSAWEARLEQMRFMVYGRGLDYYNWYLVETLTVAALLRSGLTSAVPGSILADPDAARATITSYLNSVVLAKAGEETTVFGDQALLLLSDPPDTPPAYHGLSLALFAKSVALLGSDAEASARAVLDRMGRATWGLMAPDGDVAWFGRSQEQSWAPAMSAAGLLTASRVHGIERPDADRLRAAAARALQRLASTDYASAAYGLWVTPAVAGPQPRTALGGLDRYAAATSYTGLTLLGLDWVAEDPNGQEPTPAAAIAADTPNGGLRLGDHGAFIVLRSATTWMAVKQAPAAQRHYAQDLRYESGLDGLEVVRADGTWDRVLPPRPLTTRARFDPAGPVLLRDGARARAVGRSIASTPQAIVLDADYLTALGTRLGAHRKLRFEPVACGVRISLRALPGETWEYSAFFRGRPRRTGPRQLTDGAQTVTASGPSVQIAPAADRLTYQSAQDARLVRWRLRVRHAHREPVTFTVCRAG